MNRIKIAELYVNCDAEGDAGCVAPLPAMETVDPMVLAPALSDIVAQLTERFEEQDQIATAAMIKAFESFEATRKSTADALQQIVRGLKDQAS